MTSLLVFDRHPAERDAVAEVLRDVGLDVTTTDASDVLRAALAEPRVGLIVLGEHDAAVKALLTGPLRRRTVPLVCRVESGDFDSLVSALSLNADRTIARDRSAAELVACVRAALDDAAQADRGEERAADEVVVDVDGRPQQLRVSTERLLGLVAQVCEDAARARRRYDAELQHRQRVETALMQSESFYESLVETLPLALFRKDLDSRIIFANHLMCEALRRPLDGVVGKTDYDFFPENLAEKYRADDRRVIESGQAFETIEEFQTPTGERRFTHVIKSPVYDSAGTAIGIQGVFSDVTDRMRAEAELEQERYLLDNLMQSIPDNIYFKNAEGAYLRINPAKARGSGLQDPREAIGRSDVDFFSREHAQKARIDELRVMQTGQPLIGDEERIEYADGRVRWMSTTKLPLRDRQGEVIGTFGVSRDITPLKQAQSALEAAAAAADAANRAKSDFLANMSHEIRTPLNAILGMTELVLDTPLTPVQRDYLRLVQESGESLLLVINDILDFSKIEAGKLQLEQTPFELREFLGDTLKSLGLRAHRKELELILDVAPSVPDTLVGDPHRLRQVLVNLVGNAIKFTEHGEILLGVSCDALANDQIELHFRVSDTGIGIPPDKFATIFDAFEQADRSTTRRFGGTGLGLAICARLVALMGGRIWVESELGQGSTFHFTGGFRPSATRCLPCDSAPPELLQGLRVLVVDDNSTNRRILAEMLASWGMLPVLVSCAADALAELRRQELMAQPFGLVLSDVHMPGQSGFDLVRQARRDGLYGKGVVMMLTSGDRADDLDACRELGVSTYLIKPVKQSELFNAILQALGAAHHEQWKTAALAEARTATRALDVLLAEDSAINQKLAIGLLERWGHRVTVANDGLEAVALAGQRAFDLVLMDIQMPEMDGLDATRTIRARESGTGRHVPIVAMTAHALQGDRERCLDSGMDDYLTKPIRSEQLFQVLERYADPPKSAENNGAPPTSVSNVPPPGKFPQDVIGLPKASLVDWSRALNTAAGDSLLLRDITQAFLEEAPMLVERAGREFTSADWKRLQRTTHTLKSTLATFGVNHGAARARDIETACANGEPPPSAALADVATAVAEATAEMRNYLQTHPPQATISAAIH